MQGYGTHSSDGADSSAENNDDGGTVDNEAIAPNTLLTQENDLKEQLITDDSADIGNIDDTGDIGGDKNNVADDVTNKDAQLNAQSPVLVSQDDQPVDASLKSEATIHAEAIDCTRLGGAKHLSHADAKAVDTKAVSDKSMDTKAVLVKAPPPAPEFPVVAAQKVANGYPEPAALPTEDASPAASESKHTTGTSLFSFLPRLFRSKSS